MKRRLNGTLGQPLPWRIIDAVVSLEEAEENNRRSLTAACATIASTSAQNDSQSSSIETARHAGDGDTYVTTSENIRNFLVRGAAEHHPKAGVADGLTTAHHGTATFNRSHKIALSVLMD